MPSQANGAHLKVWNIHDADGRLVLDQLAISGIPAKSDLSLDRGKVDRATHSEHRVVCKVEIRRQTIGSR